MNASSEKTTASTGSDESAEFLQALGEHRNFLRFTARDLTDEQAGQRTTASELCVGGLIKHVTAVEQGWVGFIEKGPSAMPDFSELTEADYQKRADEFRMLPGETLAGVLDAYAEVAARTDALVASLPDLGLSHPLPKAPWFQADAHWSVRRVLMHIIAETAQHAGHADIIREALDGQKTMG
ncbi:DinB family protein [Streptomyces sp. NBC_00525]|uniref:DinB family protein n=1 Tax=Streptomyces sp. NBC_00525 TaxID=2903660 RepID=UPI002E7FCA46|nr:DinB family protein [Streptomyces sp. NBC_00525]WUC96149.1 DinB family protein [Streptomyces sp. NBC_00525]